MKIVIINFSGNVGKSTIATNLLAPNIPTAKIYSIESINSGADANGMVIEKLAGKKFGNLLEAIALLDDAIIDVGASNVESFLHQMHEYDGSADDFDLFLIPVVPESKAQIDTVSTIDTLITMGVPKSKIRLIFNRVDKTGDFESDFAKIRAYLIKIGLDKNAAKIYANEAYDRLKSKQLSISELATDETDYRKKIRDTPDQREKENAAELMALQRLAKTAKKNLDDVFACINE